MQETGTAELHYGMPKMKAIPKLSNCCASTGQKSNLIQLNYQALQTSRTSGNFMFSESK